VKINKPTFNLQINNNVGQVNNSDGGALTIQTGASSSGQAQGQEPTIALSFLQA